MPKNGAFLAKNARFSIKMKENVHFFEKKRRKILPVQKNVVLLHSHSEERSYED